MTLMSSNRDPESLRDDAWDEKYFLLILELSEKNASRYESQAKLLLENKCFKYSLNGVDILYKLTPMGCRFYSSENANGVKESSWNRMGWTKSSKARALPFFFAKSEAGVLID
jgi:hypothetical protein